MNNFLVCGHLIEIAVVSLPTIILIYIYLIETRIYRTVVILSKALVAFALSHKRDSWLESWGAQAVTRAHVGGGQACLWCGLCRLSPTGSRHDCCSSLKASTRSFGGLSLSAFLSSVLHFALCPPASLVQSIGGF